MTADEIAEFGIGTLGAFETARKTALIADFGGLSAADQAGTPGQNIKTRVAHLGGDGGLGVASHPKAFLAGLGWNVKEEYGGLINSAIQFGPNNSTVLSYLAGYGSFIFLGKFFNFHADEQSGYTQGSLTADPSSGIPALQTGIYNAESREAAPFNPLNVSQLNEPAIDAVLAAGSVAQKLVVSVSGSLSRLVVSEAVITNPMDPPASWQITSRGDSLVGLVLPQASVFPRDLFFTILPPGQQQKCARVV